MSLASDIPGWEHKSGYRVNNDGCAIVYERSDGAEAWVEGMLREDYDPVELHCWGLFRSAKDADGAFEELDGPKVWVDKDRAIEWLESTMRSNAVYESEPQ